MNKEWRRKGSHVAENLQLNSKLRTEKSAREEHFRREVIFRLLFPMVFFSC